MHAVYSKVQSSHPVEPHPGTINCRLKIGQIVRQGDVLIQRVAELPAALAARMRRDLAPGTAHSHVADEPAQTFDAPDGAIWISSPAPFAVSHSTHRNFVLGAGTYRTWRQVEADVRPAANSRRLEIKSRVVRD